MAVSTKPSRFRVPWSARISLRTDTPAASRRRFIPSPSTAPEEYDIVIVDGLSFRVRRHWFWPEFGQGWEESTYRFFRTFVDPYRPVLDLGSWIGPTVLFAAACGARRIVAVEGNPATVEHLRATQSANPGTLGGLVTVNAVVHPTAGLVAFGNLDGSRATSSAASVRGRGFVVRSLTIGEIIRDFACHDACIVKIDIEGSELDVADQIADLAPFGSAILLSLHPPFWPRSSDARNLTRILANLRGFRVFDPNGIELGEEDVGARLRYTESTPPSWGTRFGNFFELVLLPR